MADIQKVKRRPRRAGRRGRTRSAVQASLREDELADATADMRDSVASFTFDGDRDDVDHVSGAPVERELVLGSEDPRDASLEERPLSEDVAWTGTHLQRQPTAGRAARRASRGARRGAPPRRGGHRRPDGRGPHLPGAPVPHGARPAVDGGDILPESSLPGRTRSKPRAASSSRRRV